MAAPRIKLGRKVPGVPREDDQEFPLLQFKDGQWVEIGLVTAEMVQVHPGVMRSQDKYAVGEYSVELWDRDADLPPVSVRVHRMDQNARRMQRLGRPQWVTVRTPAEAKALLLRQVRAVLR